MIRAISLALGLAFAALPVAAQQQPTLADLRQQLRALSGDLQSLRGEMMASGAAGFQAAGGDDTLSRMDAMESRIAQLTGQAEQLQHRIDRIVRDGTMRINDIEFRLCEMDENCDLGALMTAPDLGSGGSGGGGVSVPLPGGDIQGRAPVEPDQPQLALTRDEQADFEAARAVMAEGDFRRAADLFGQVAQKYAGGPLTAEALFLRGAALDGDGDGRGAAAAWLEGFAADPNGARAPESLLGLARVIAAQGDELASCLYLAEIPVRFPESPSAIEAERRMAELSCGQMPLEQPGGDEASADLAEHG